MGKHRPTDDEILEAIESGMADRAIARNLKSGRRRISRLRKRSGVSTSPHKTAPRAVDTSSGSMSVTGNGASATMSSDEPITEAALIEYFGVDTERWQMVEFVPQVKEQARKHIRRNLKFEEGKITGKLKDDGRMVKVKLYSARARFQIRKAWIDRDLAREFAVALHESKPPTLYAPKKRKLESPDILELALPDVHHGLRSLAEETGEEYNLETSTRLVRAVVEDLLAKSGTVSRIVIPIGNDWLNSDNAAGTTSKGTKQDEDSHWSLTFKRATMAAVEVINLARTYCDAVDVLLIPGNHDTERSHYLATCLGYAFAQCDDVTIDDGLSPIKARLLHDTLVVWHHGDRAKPDDLAKAIPERWPEMWGKSQWRELHLGHIHHEVERDIGAIRVRNFRCLSAQSAWSSKNGYSNLRAGTSVRYGLGVGPYQVTYSFARSLCHGN